MRTSNLFNCIFKSNISYPQDTAELLFTHNTFTIYVYIHVLTHKFRIRVMKHIVLRGGGRVSLSHVLVNYLSDYCSLISKHYPSKLRML